MTTTKTISEQVDLVVVGAGFAGLACAQAAAARGLRCVVLEKQEAPGARVRTTGILVQRSEERRVGKECRSRWSPYH